jgi:bifunctional non-homologous end joining protein LigD
MFASAAAQLPQGPGWSYEVKWNGYRTLAIKDGARVKLLSRNLKDATRRYPSVAREVARLQPESVLLDGEVVAIDDQGRPSFQALHHQAAHSLVFYAFDVLHLDGRDLTAISLDERRDVLANVLKGSRLLAPNRYRERRSKSRRRFAHCTLSGWLRSGGTLATSQGSGIGRGSR